MKEVCHVYAHKAAQGVVADGAAEAAAKPSNPFAMAKAAAAAASKTPTTAAAAAKATPPSTASGTPGSVSDGGALSASPECILCLPAGISNTVESYPRKPPKKASKEENIAVVVCSRHTAGEPEYLIAQRPKKGLLANMWEFPNGPFSPGGDGASAVGNSTATGTANSSQNGGGAGGGGGGAASAPAKHGSSSSGGGSKEDSDLKEAIRRSLQDAHTPDAMNIDAAAADAANEPKPVVVSPFFTVQRPKAAASTGKSTAAKRKGKGKSKPGTSAETKLNTHGQAGNAAGTSKTAAKKPKKLSAAAIKAAAMDEVARGAAASAAARTVLASSLGVPEHKLAPVHMQPCGAVLHIFSHIRHTYSVWSVDAAAVGPEHVAQLPGLLNGKWLSRSDLLKAAVSTNMKKVFACVEKANGQHQ